MVLACLRGSVAPDPTQPISRTYVGLKNPGFTCHMNTVLQAMYHTPEFRSGLLACAQTGLPPTGKAVQTIFARLAQGSRPVSTKPLSSALRHFYAVNRQQDCHDEPEP